MNIVRLLLGTLAPALLLTLVAVHVATGRPPLTWPRRIGREERGRQRSQRAHVRDLALGPAQMATLTDLTTWDDATDDAEPVDMAALMVEQDIEEGREFVARIEHMLAVETAVSFGFIYLEGAGKR